MKKINWSILIIAMAILSSCYSTLKVKVDILALKDLKQSADYKFMEAEALKDLINGGYLTNLKSKILTSYRMALESKVPSIPKDQIEESMSKVNLNIAKTFDMVEVSARQLITAGTNSPADSGGYRKAMEGYQNSKVVLSGMLTLLKDELRRRSDTIAEKFQRDLDAKITNEVNSIFGISIINDRMASFVVRAPKYMWSKFDKDVNILQDLNSQDNTKKWTRSRINVTVGKTLFGNADIAVKMESPGYFVIKGVRVDADQALIASFKTLSQGIKYLAYATGTPVPQTSGNSSITTIPEVADLEASKASYEAAKTRLKLATEQFAQTLINERPFLRRPDERKRAIARIQIAYNAYKATLNQQ